MSYILSIVLFFLLLFPFFKIKGDKTKYYQLPIVYSLTTFALIIPSLFSELFSRTILTESEYCIFTLNIILCLLASYVGYSFKPKIAINNQSYNLNKVLLVVIPFFIIGFYISFFVIKAEVFGSVFGGLFAILIFFARLIRPTAIIIMFIHLIKPRRLTFFLLVIWILVPLRFIIISGRRSEFFLLAITLLLPFFFVKNYIPNRKLLVVGGLVAFSAYFILPLTRVYTKEGNFNAIKDIEVFQSISSYSQGEKTNEVFEAAINMNLVFQNNGYSYGGLYINKFVNQFASSTFFGDGLKESLQVGSFDLESVRNEVASTRGKYRNYLAPTGYVDSFYDFGFLSFIPFFIFARVARRLWTQAFYSKNFYSKVYYVYFVVLMFMSIYDSLSFLPILLVQAAIVFLPIKYLSKS